MKNILMTFLRAYWCMVATNQNIIKGNLGLLFLKQKFYECCCDYGEKLVSKHEMVKNGYHSVYIIII